MTHVERARQIEACARRIRILIDAGEYQAAIEQLAEAKRLTLEALNETEEQSNEAA